MTATLTPHPTFDHTRVDVSDGPTGRNLPQRVGRRGWAPMLVMALMAWPVSVVLGFVRADAVAAGSEVDVAALGHLLPAVTFLGFTAVFSAIAFAIARILGEFRVGGSQVQHSIGAPVHTLAMPGTAKAFIATMAMAMMMLLVAVAAHAVVATQIWAGNVTLLADAETWAVGLEAVRRFASALYLVSILLGLATIVRVLRFQVLRLNHVAAGKA